MQYPSNWGSKPITQLRNRWTASYGTLEAPFLSTSFPTSPTLYLSASTSLPLYPTLYLQTSFPLCLPLSLCATSLPLYLSLLCTSLLTLTTAVGEEVKEVER